MKRKVAPGGPFIEGAEAVGAGRGVGDGMGGGVRWSMGVREGGATVAVPFTRAGWELARWGWDAGGAVRRVRLCAIGRPREREAATWVVEGAG